MTQSVNENLGLALRMLLKPVVKLLIAQGITHKDFSEAAKEAFVEVALRQQTSGDRVNRSRVAIVTGLTRKEVKNVIDRALSEGTAGRQFSRPGRVLAGWFNDPAYNGPYGFPLEIPYDSPDQSGAPPSFVHLVRVYSGDQSAVQMLDELLRVKAVEKLDDGNFKVLRPDFEPDSLSPRMIERYGDIAFNVLTTLSANVQKTGLGEGVFDRAAISNERLTADELEKFGDFLKSRGHDMMVEIDNWLTRNITKKTKTDREVFESGVSMLQFITLDPSEKTTLKDLLLEKNFSIEKTDKN